MVEDISALSADNLLANLWRSLGFSSLAALPLHARGNVVGAMVYLTRFRRGYGEAEMAALHTIADILGSGLENARLHTQCQDNSNALQQANRRLAIFERLVEDSGNLTLVLDRHFVILVANSAYARFRGLPLERIVGHEGRNVVGEADFDGLIRPNVDRAFAGKPVQFEAWFEHSSMGRRYLEPRQFPLSPDGASTSWAYS